jgi:Fe-S-cluster containining protein
MVGASETCERSMTASVKLAGPDWELRTTMSVPQGPMRLGELLPLVQSFGDAVAASATKAAEGQGEKVSCKKGCGACCRQLVPIAEVEARRLAQVVRELPEPRRAAVRARFAAARRRLEEAGLLAKLLRRHDEWSEDEVQSFGLTYFHQGIPCPFLEAESCSIHADRPLVCREYLVTSPAEHCVRPTPETIERVRMPFKVWTALALFDGVPAERRLIRWVPLVLAPEWAEAHPEEPEARPGPDLLAQFFEHVTRQKVPPVGQVPSPIHELPVSTSAAEKPGEPS